MHVSDVIKHKGGAILSLTADRPLSIAIALMAEQAMGAIVVLGEDGSRPIGIVTEPDVVAALNARGADALQHSVRQAMREPAPFCSPDDSVTDALARMTGHRTRYLIVATATGSIAGLVSIGDLVKARLDSAELEAGVLRDMARGRLWARA